MSDDTGVASSYLRPIINGQRISLADFILLCARQSRELAFMRGLPLLPSIRIPDEIPQDLDLDVKIQHCEEQIAVLKKRSLNNWAHAADDDYKSKVTEAVRQNNENADIRDRLTKMQARVISFFRQVDADECGLVQAEIDHLTWFIECQFEEEYRARSAKISLPQKLSPYQFRDQLIGQLENQLDLAAIERALNERDRLEINRYLKGVKALAALAKKSKTPSAESESQPEESDQSPPPQ